MARSTKLLRFAFWLNIGFAVFEAIGGWYSGSLAILSDAFHDFGDSLSLGMAWYFQHLSLRKSDDKFSFGYARFSTLGALVNSIILFVGSAAIIFYSISEFGEREAPLSGWMMVIAVIGVFINGLAFKKLHAGSSLNEKTAALHLFEDVMGWIAVLIGAIAIYFTGFVWIDPALSILIALWIGINATKQIRRSSQVFMQSVPPGIDLEEIKEQIESDERISNVHEPRIWSLDGEEHVMSIHIVLKEDLKISEIDGIRRDLKKKLKLEGLQEITLQFEAPKDQP